MKISLILPVFNEEENIPLTVPIVKIALQETGVPSEVIIVDDGSTDNTWDAILNLKDPMIKIIKHDRNLGVGAAIRTGLGLSKGDVVIVFDADLSYESAKVGELLKSIQNCDIALCSPYMKGGSVVDISYTRHFLSWLVSSIYALVTGVNLTCFTSMVRAYRAEALRSIKIEHDGFESQAEMIVKLAWKGFRIVEIPGVLTGRKKGYSKFKVFRETYRTAKLLLELLSMRLSVH